MKLNVGNMRMRNQQLVNPEHSNPADLVSHMGAMQAQEYRLMRWAVAMRTKGTSAEAFRKAYDEGGIIRLHLLRGTWHMISAADYHWMLALCGQRGLSVLKGWMRASGVSVSDEEAIKVRDVLCITAGHKRSATKEDFSQALRSKGLEIDDRMLSYHIQLAEYDGVLCSGKLLSMKATYSLVSQRIAPASGPIGKDDAMLMLARRYFKSHSPATLADFVWWSGMNIGDCRKALRAMNNEIDAVDISGETYYLHRESHTADCRKSLILLPSYDEYLLGYKSRWHVIADEYRSRAFSNKGIFYPVVLRGSQAIGTWKWNTGEAEFFKEDYAKDITALYGRFLKVWNKLK